LHGWLGSTSNIAQGTVESFNVELILQSHAYAVQGSHEFAMLCKILVKLIGLLGRFVEKNFGKATKVSGISRTIAKLNVPVCLCMSAMWEFSLRWGMVHVCEHR
jgi:hypothetical protein